MHFCMRIPYSHHNYPPSSLSWLCIYNLQLAAAIPLCAFACWLSQTCFASLSSTLSSIRPVSSRVQTRSFHLNSPPSAKTWIESLPHAPLWLPCVCIARFCIAEASSATCLYMLFERFFFRSSLFVTLIHSNIRSSISYFSNFIFFFFRKELTHFLQQYFVSTICELPNTSISRLFENACTPKIEIKIIEPEDESENGSNRFVVRGFRRNEQIVRSGLGLRGHARRAKDQGRVRRGEAAVWKWKEPIESGCLIRTEVKWTTRH